MAKTSERWGTRLGLILAVAGNAVGLGNFLRFPKEAAANGGGDFIIPYLISFVLMGIPLLWIEWGIGRRGGQFGYHSTPGMLDTLGKSRVFKYFGAFGIFTNLIVAAYYAYIESWTLAYVWFSITGAFQGMNAEQVSMHFLEFLDSGGDSFINFPTLALLFFIITISINLYILSRGLTKGIEMAGKILMPLLLLFGLMLAIRAITLDAGEAGAVYDAVDGLNFLWEPNFASLTNPNIWLAAAGQIFFTLSVGMGTILTYAAYLREKDDIALNATTAGFMNEFVEVVLGASIIIPISVAYLGIPWMEENVGFAMGFMTMPSLFNHWGPLLAALGGLTWFGLLFFAGITSSLAMGQPVLAFLQDHFNFTRKRATLVFGAVIFMLALPAILLYDRGAFGEYDYWAGTFSLVVFALGEAVIFTWFFGIDKAWDEINKGADLKIPGFFKYILKYVTPTFLLAVFIGSLIKPVDSQWALAFTTLFNDFYWPFAPDSVIGNIMHVGVEDTTQIWVMNSVRTLMVVVYAMIGALIALAWKIKERREEGGFIE